MKNRAIKIVLSYILMMLTVFNSLPINLISFAEGTDNAGVGIINNVKTDDGETVTNSYKIMFYTTQTVGVPPDTHEEYQLLDHAIPEMLLNGKTNADADRVYVGSNGEFTISSGNYVDFLSSQDFIDFVNTNNVTRVSFTLLDNSETPDFHLYSINDDSTLAVNKTFVYDFPRKKTVNDYLINPDTGDTELDENNQPIVIGTHEEPVAFDPKNPENEYYSYYSTLNKAEFLLTVMTDVDVNVLWHDRGANRTTPEFTITRDPDDDFVQPTPTQTTHDSNNETYTYRVPKYQENGTPYTYTSVVTAPAAGSNYRVDDSNAANNTYTYYSQRTFECNLVWKTGADTYSPTREDILAYLNNFELIDQTDNNAVVTIDHANVEYNPSTGRLIISGLDEISAEGTAKAYYLRPKDQYYDTDNHTIDRAVEQSDPDYSATPTWTLEAQNEGVYSNETVNVFHNATLENVRSATESTSVNVYWRDEENKSTREGMSNTGDLILWRHPDIPNDPNAEFLIAQVETRPLSDNTAVQNPDGSTTYTFTNTKYDEDGYPYVYYVKENLSPSLGGYTVAYNNDNLSNTTQAYDDGTIINKLEGRVAFTINAKWIAAARQGGSAEIKYQVQQKKDDNTWETMTLSMPYGENGAMIDTDTIVMNSFSAEQMSQTLVLPALDKYDENGKKYEYRIIQTEIERTDNIKGTSVHGEYTGDVTDSREIQLKDGSSDADKYALTLKNTGDTYTFSYKLIGDANIKIRKVWDDSGATIDHSNHTVTYELLRQNFNTGVFEDYTGNTGSITSADNWEVTVHPDAYDEEGHSYLYQVREISSGDTANSYHTTYKYDKTENRFTITNKKTTEGGVGIWLEKKWMDDGEEEYRKPVTITASENVYKNANGTFQSQNRTLTEDDMWEGEIFTYNNSSTAPTDYYHYNSDDFTESNSSVNSTYTLLSNFNNVPTNYASPDGAKWIYHLMSNRGSGEANTHSVSLANQTYIANSDYFGPTQQSSNKNFVAIYKTPDHYYAVEQEVTMRANGDFPSRIKFINTRIGVVSFKVNFDWIVGDWLEDGSQDNQNVVLKIVGTKGNGTTVEYTHSIPISEIKSITQGNQKINASYYIKDFPKYDELGKIITYKLSEVSIAGSQVDQNGHCTVGTENISVSIKEEPFVTGKDSHSDDLFTYTITNRFSATTSLTVYKIWRDDNRPLAQRPNIYLRRQRRTVYSDEEYATEHLGPGDDEWEVERGDYLWTRNDDDQHNHWSYTFSELPKYDANGFRYEYRVEELKINEYKKEYLNGNTVVANPKDQYAYNGYTIRNTRYGEVSIDGEKLWSNINEVFKKENYPVAEVYLYRKEARGTNEEQYVDSDTDIVDNGTTVTIPYSRAVNAANNGKGEGLVIARTKIYCGDNTFKFSGLLPYIPESYKVRVNDNGSLVLPKYDDKGRLITYNLGERAISGYAFRITNQKIINTYDGGDPITIEVTKRWHNVEKVASLPTVKVTLHQVAKVKTLQLDGNGRPVVPYEYVSQNGQPVYSYIEYNKFEATLSNSNLNEVKDQSGHVKYLETSYTFGSPHEDLRRYAPDGEEFLYFVTEDMTNYKGTTVHFNTTDNNNTYVQTIGGQSVKIMGDYVDSGDGYICSISAVSNKAAVDGGGNPILDGDNPTYDPTKKEAVVDNSYEPDDENYKGKLIVNKSWDFKTGSNGDTGNNSNNSEFNNDLVKGYKFIVSRKTLSIAEKSLIDVDTTCKYSSPSTLSERLTAGKYPSVSVDAPSEIFNFTLEKPMTAYSSSDEVITDLTDDSSVAYYRVEYSFSKTAYSLSNTLPLTVTIYKDKHVVIDGLAEFALDMDKYTYTVTEKDASPFKLAAPVSATMEDITETDGGNTVTVQKATFRLNNVLDVFDLRLQKKFGKTYKDENGQERTVELKPEEYREYFNNTYVDQLSFKLYRSSDGGTNWETYKTLNRGSLEHSGNSNPADAYYYVFKDLPVYNTDGTVKFRYKAVEDTDDGAAGQHVTVTQPNPVIAPDNNEELTTSVQNNFQAKQIEINKYWDDSDNCDGMRPKKLLVTVKEYIPNEANPVEINSILENNDTDVSKSWRKYVQLPKYYYNAREPVSGLKYTFDETLNPTPQNLESFTDTELDIVDFKNVDSLDPLNSNYSLKEWGYLTLDQLNSSPPTYIKTPQTGSNMVNIDDSQFHGLYLENTKTRISGRLSIDKAWSTDVDKTWGVRPDIVYVKVMRVLEDGSEPAEEARYNDGTAIGVLTLSKAGQSSGNPVREYCTDLDNIPYGKITNTAGLQTNGTFKKYKYYVVECDSAGTVYNQTNAPNFGYEWTQTIGTDNEAQKELELSFDENGKINNASLGSVVTNTPKLMTQKFEKHWDDEDNTYNTRNNIVVHLLRKKGASGAWVDLSSGSTLTLTNDKKIAGTNTYAEKTYPISNYNQTRYSDSTSFTNLPKYDSDGERFYYRIMEYQIGNMVAWGSGDSTHNNVGPGSHQMRTWDYYIDSSDTDGLSHVENKIVTRDDFQDIELKKDWNDYLNQDGLRPEKITFTLKRQVKVTKITVNGEEKDTDTMVDKEINSTDVDADDNWTYRWKDCPMYTPDGKIYYYYISESTIPGYTAQTPYYSEGDHGFTGVITEPDGTKVEKITFTNTHTPVTTDLDVEKTWVDSNNKYSLRPAKIRFDLYCSYNNYTSTDNGKTSVSAGTFDDSIASAGWRQGNLFPPKNSNSEIISSITTDVDCSPTPSTNKTTVKFTGLPMYLNPTGDTRYRGVTTPVPITYYVKETMLDSNGNNITANKTKDYNCPDDLKSVSVTPSSLTAGTAAITTLTNTLNTHDVKVYKTWDDTGLVSDMSHHHYDLDITLKSNSFTQNDGSTYYTETKTLQADSSAGVTFTGLPRYANGTAVTYLDVEEKAHHASGDTSTLDYYFGYTRSTAADVKTYEDSNNTILSTVTLTNELPTTQFTITKNWDDSYDSVYNKWRLRPDQIEFGLERRVEGGQWESIDTNPADETQAKTVIMKSGVSQGTADTQPSWTVTVSGLRKFSEDNKPYQFRVTEPDIHAYEHVSASSADGISKNIAITAYKRDNQNNITGIENVTFENKLITQNVKVIKQWDFNGCTEEPKYPLDITVSHTHTDSTPNTPVDISITKPLDTNTTYVDNIPVPVYDKAGHKITYTVTEKAHNQQGGDQSDHHYGYAKSPSVITGTITPVAESELPDEYPTTPLGPNMPNQCVLKNVLPVTKVNVTKKWDDLHNIYGLRPTDVTFELYRTTVQNATTSTPITSDPATGWVKITSPTYYVEPSVTKTTSSGNNFDTWTFSYDNLLRYSESNALYRYMVREVYNGQTLGAYEMLVSDSPASYQSVDVNKATSGDAASHDVEFTNRLIRRNITVTKDWNETWGTGADARQYGTSLRYATTFTLSSSAINYTDDKQLAVDGTSVTFNDLPKYSANHTPIAYKLVENAVGAASGTVYSSLNGLFEQKSRKSGYVGTCVKTDVTNETGVVDTYAVTNTLPLEHFTAQKVWKDDNNRDGLRPVGSNDNKFQFVLTQTLGGSSNETRETVSQADDWYKDFGLYPTYDPTNTAYTYSMTENETSAVFKYADKYSHTNNVSQTTPEKITTTVGNTSSELTVEHNSAYQFTNEHDPIRSSISLSKSWNDSLHSTYTRPDTIQVKLKCRKKGSSTWADAENTDYVKKFVRAIDSNYQFTRTLNTASLASSSESFDNLPLYVNNLGNEVTGYNPVYDSSSSKFTHESNQSLGGASGETVTEIEYFIEEVNTKQVTGYTASYSPAESTGVTWERATVLSTGAVQKTETITNTLKTKNVTVQKTFDDNNHTKLYPDEVKHYSVNVKIDPVTITTYTGGTAQTIKDVSDASAAEQEKTATFVNVPLYDKNGDPLEYKLEELTDTNNGGVLHYNYSKSYSTASGTALATANGQGSFKPAEGQDRLMVTNTLPTTQVTVEKHWEDTRNCYSLRPSSVTLNLYRTTVANPSRSDMTTKPQGTSVASSGWEFVKTETLSSPSGTNTDCSVTFTDLLEFDSSNNRYVFMVVEDNVNAYTTAYTTGYLLTTDSQKTLKLTNTLQTKNVTIKKQWNDNSYSAGDSLHYKIFVKMEASSINGRIPQTISFSGENVYIDPQNTATTLRDNVTIQNVPIYDMSGTKIDYTISEKPFDENFGDSHYGYERKDTVTQSWETVNEHTIVNELPVVNVTVNKNWVNSYKYHKYSPSNITVDVTRSTQHDNNHLIHDDFTLPVTTDATTHVSSNTHTFNNELKFDYNNAPYTYTATEQPVIKGYTRTTPSANASASNGDVTLNLTNTQITRDVTLTKTDGTYHDLYSTYPGFRERVLAGAKFTLHRVKTSDDPSTIVVDDNTTQADETICKLTGSNGSYTFDENGSVTEIVSGANGQISIASLPLGKYKLVETEAPTGYHLRATDYEFTVDVNDAYENSDTYPDDGNIRNEQITASATLTKVDAGASNAPIKNNPATYYLLRLIPRELAKNKHDNESAYLSAAKNAVYTFDFSDASSSKQNLEQYWDVVKPIQTDANGTNSVSLIEFGTYFFMEYRAPVGYKLDNSVGFSVDSDGESGSGGYADTDVFTVTAQNQSIKQLIRHSDQRKPAKVKISKTDDFGNGLNGAVFELYKKGTTTADDEYIATVLTGDDGLNKYVVFDKSTTPEQMRALSQGSTDSSRVTSDNAIILSDWGTYYFKEVSPPFGYSEEQNGVYEFTVNYEIADKVVHIVNAKDAQKKGSVVLTKVAGERVGTYSIGDPLPGATFKLTKKDGTQVLLKEDGLPGHYVVDSSGTLGDQTNPLHTADSASGSGTGGDEYSTGGLGPGLVQDKGKLYISGLEWGEYTLYEVSAPTGFAVNSDPISFTVGRNNCEEEQQLICCNMGVKAKLNIKKSLTEYRTNWGEPTFIFKIKQVAAPQTERTVAITFDSQYVTEFRTSTSSSGTAAINRSKEDIRLEPGLYDVTEVNVSRYSLKSIGYTLVDKNSTTLRSAVEPTENESLNLSGRTIRVNIGADETATLDFTNDIAYYDKFSHTSVEQNNFDGVKGIKVSYPGTISTENGTLNSTDGHYYQQINKSALAAFVLKSSGAQVANGDTITGTTTFDVNDLVISYNYNATAHPHDDSRFKVISNADTFDVLCDPIISAGSVYTLTASYTYEGHTFTTDFDISFVKREEEPKVEVTVVFKNDTNNASYFTDGSEKTSQYAFTYVMTGSGATRQIKEIKHNGTVVSNSDTYDIMQNLNLSVNDALQGTYQFNSKWMIGNAAAQDYTSDDIKQRVLAANDGAIITLTASLDSITP